MRKLPALLLAGEAMEGDLVAAGHADGKPFHNARAFFGLWAHFFFLGWHLFGAAAAHDFRPHWRVFDADVFGERVESEAPPFAGPREGPISAKKVSAFRTLGI